MEEYLRELELDAHASWEDVQKSYRELLRVWHPDRFSEKDSLKEKAEERTRALNSAFENISKNWDRWESEKNKGGKHYRNRSLPRKPTNIDTQEIMRAAKRTAALYVELRHTKRVRRWSKLVFWCSLLIVGLLLGIHFYGAESGKDDFNFSAIIKSITGSGEEKKEEYKPLNWRKIDSIKKK